MPPAQSGKTNQIRAIEVITLDSLQDNKPLCIVGTSQGAVFAVPTEGALVPQLIFQDETLNIVTSIATTKTLISLDGAHSQTLLALGLSDGEVVLLLIDRPLEQSESTFTCTTLSRIKVSDIKILNVYLLAEQSTDKTFCVDLLASNGRTELIRTSLSLERMEGQYRLVSAQSGTFTVGIKTQYICIQLMTPSVLVAGDTKGNIFVFDYQAPGEAYQQLKAHKNERVISLYYCQTTHQLYSTSKDNYINLYRLSPETSRPRLSKTTSLKEEDLNVIQCLSIHSGRRLIMLGFYGNYAYLWNKQDHQ